MPEGQWHGACRCTGGEWRTLVRLGAKDVRRARTARSEMGELLNAEGWCRREKKKKTREEGEGEEEGGKEEELVRGLWACAGEREKKKEKIRKRNEER